MKIIRYESPEGAVGLAAFNADGTATKLTGSLLEKLEPTGEPAHVARLRAPLDPTAILCIGLNYRKHAAESNAPLPKFPVLFFKNPASVQDPDGVIELPHWLPSTQVDYECELAVVIGKRAKNVPREKATEYVLGYTAANDVSARDWQKEGGGGQWCKGKSFDTFCPLGPCIVTPDEMKNPNSLGISTIVNGIVLQDWHTDDMIFDVPTLIEFLSASMTLLPGTVILTGTPHGVGMARTPPRWLAPGDLVTVAIEGIGKLSNTVIDEGCEGASKFHL
jgi:2-keto-4-pentenoate hydratase/2-oxohepta-3-ene-1,7-dioic acid hydratase in catechol pathway